MDKKSLRSIPPVDELLGAPELARLRSEHPAFPFTYLVREVLGAYRAGVVGPLPADRDGARAAILRTIAARLETLQMAGTRRVINGTGVILHTNLGRAILGHEVKEAAKEAMDHYVNLEVDLGTGKRSHRADTLNDLIRIATESEAAMVVNNNAAAVYLVVSSYSPPGRVIISRGELVEIGGSFRLPDILTRAAQTVIEVGTTNRTYIKDYARVAEPGDILMKAHPSNYDIQGFAHDTAIGDLVELAAKRQCRVVYDLGSGSFFDFAGIGIEGEERVKDVLRSGVDCVTMSGDKLLGGVQAGIIVGRAAFVNGLKDNPLRRAVRIDKITIMALQALFRTYLFGGNPKRDVPVLAMSTHDITRLKGRAEDILAGLPGELRAAYQTAIVDDEAAIGGGSFACQDVPSVAIAFRCQTEKEAMSLAKRMRQQKIPILPRIKGVEIRINMRSVLYNEDGDLSENLRSALAKR